MNLLEVKNLTVSFHSGPKPVVAVDNLSFSIQPGETVAVVGESGSGKTTAALALTRLTPPPPTALFRKSPLAGWDRPAHLLQLHPPPSSGRQSCLHLSRALHFSQPRILCGFSDCRGFAPSPTQPAQYVRRGNSLAWPRGDSPTRTSCSRLPHQLSGGMQQRAMIAMALACQPKLLVADEPTTALDVTIQAQILDLLRELRQKLGMSVLLITHNFGIVANFADRVLVMLEGKLVEEGPVKQILRSPTPLHQGPS